MLEFLQSQGSTILQASGQHLFISYAAIILGILLAVPLGIVIVRNNILANIFLGIANILQTIPTLAMLALMIPLFGIGTWPAIIALFVYSILPILRGTYDGINDVDENLVEAGKGMGMTPWQILTNIELPLAFPVIMNGIKLSSVYVISGASLASYIGAGGLGTLIFNGMELFQFELVLAGTIPAVVIVVITLFILDLVEKYVNKRNGVDLSHV